MRPQIAQAHRRSHQLHLMPLLMARLERQLMRGIWAAVDRPNPTNCRRTVAKRAPHQTASLTGYLKRAPIGPKSLPFCYFEWNYRCLEGGVLPTTHRSMTNRPWCRLNNRIGPRCAPRSDPRSNPRLGGSNTCLAPYFNILTFSDAVCCSSQLASSSVVHPDPNAAGNALLVTDGDVDTRFVHSILFWYTLHENAKG